MPLERSAPDSSLRRTPLFWAIGWAFLSGCLLLVGCSSPPVVSEKVASPPAHLAVVNLTDYRWRITIVHSSAPPTADFQVAARESQSIDLAGGDYIIKQTVLSPDAASELSRELPAKLESGESYRWKLATLLSETPDTPVLPESHR